MLMTLALGCIRERLYLDACSCLMAILEDLPYLLNQKLSRTASSVLLNVLDSQTILPAMDVVKKMIEKNVHLGYEVCSQLVRGLISIGEKSQAEGVVRGAMELGWYQQGETTPYSLVLPPSLTKIEVDLLVKHHMTTLPKTPLHPLKLICSSGTLNNSLIIVTIISSRL